jgi:hypothetical protein
MAADVAARGLDRRGAGVARVVVAAREALDAAAVSEDLGCQHPSDAVKLGQRGGRGGHRLGERPLALIEPAIETAKVADELPGQALALGRDGAHRTDPTQKLGRPPTREPAGRATRQQVGQEAMETVEKARALGHQLVAAIRQQP